MIFGVDVSKYQGSAAVDGFDFAILNVEDPTFRDKAFHCVELGIPWDIYKWCYPGASGAAMFWQAKGIVDRAGVPGRAPGYWLDYEESGVSGNQVGEWFGAADQAGVRSGWYCYLYLLNNQGNHAPDRPLWLAYYPSASGDYWPSQSDTARNLGAKIHQFTSTGGQIDKNVILDEPWWTDWSGSGGAGSQVDWDAIRVIVHATEGDNAMAMVPDFQGHEVDLFVAANGDLIHNSFAPFGVRAVTNEVLARNNNPSVQPAARVVDGNLVVTCAKADGSLRRLAYVTGQNQWLDENNQPFGIGSS